MDVRGVGCHHTLSGSRGAPGGTCGWTVSCSACMNMASVLQQYLTQVMCDNLQQQRRGDHWNLCSPVCVYMWRARVPLSGQRASHSGHEYVSPSKWMTRRCRSRLDFSLKFFAQSTHSKSPPYKRKTFWASKHNCATVTVRTRENFGSLVMENTILVIFCAFRWRNLYICYAIRFGNSVVTF